jgi:AraC-like DNA-binding protein
MDTQNSDLAKLERRSLPVFALARDYRNGDRVPPHKHSIGQVLHTLRGVMLVDTPGQAWAIPPGRGLWLPPGTIHSFVMSGRVSVRTLYVRPPHTSMLPASPFVVDINPLVRELIIRAAQLDENAPPKQSADLIARLALAELACAPREEFALVLPQTALMKRFAALVREDPADQRTLEDIAVALGTSGKTLARRCAAETGLTPEQWRRQARLLAARALLQSGRSVTRTAADVGFGSASSFTSSFRLAYGIKPSRLKARRS